MQYPVGAFMVMLFVLGCEHVHSQFGRAGWRTCSTPNLDPLLLLLLWAKHVTDIQFFHIDIYFPLEELVFSDSVDIMIC